MKTKSSLFLAIGSFLVFSWVSVFAYVTVEFTGWSNLTHRSPHIVVAQCTKIPAWTYSQDGMETTSRGGLLNSEIEILLVLKAATNVAHLPLTPPTPGPSFLVSEYSPRQKEYYLVFATYINGKLQAFEDFRVIPLGVEFSTNSLSGKTLDEQIQFLLQRRLDNLNRELARGAEEKKRLEEGLKR